MNNLFTRLAGLGLAATVLLASCEKDEEKVVLNPSSTVTATSSASTIVLTSANAANTATTVSWNPASFGYQAAVTYTLQVDKAGNKFASPQEVTVGSATSKVFTVDELNALAIRLKMTPNVSGQLEMRVKSSIDSKISPIYSNTSTVTVTPYLVVITYPVIYVPGNYQGWNPAQAPTLGAFNTNNPNLYEGFVNIDNAAPEFKFTSVAAWSGDNFGSGGVGILSKDGNAGNLTLTSGGYYRLTADTKALTWSSVKTTWSVIGSATPNGWTSDTPLTYNAATGLWTASVKLVAGDIKFRANNDWTINFGDGNKGATPKVAPDGVLEYGGDDIAIPTAGTYTVTLDLTKPGNYTFSVK